MGILISLLIFCLIMGLIYWIIGLLPIPAPFKQIVIAIFAVICLIYLIGMLFGSFAPFPVFRGGYRF